MAGLGATLAKPAYMLMPTISRYMSRQPWTIRNDALAEEGRQLMRQHGIRHLPVLEAGVLVGVVSERDLRLAELATSGKLTIEDLMSPDVHTVLPTAAVDEVVDAMAERRIGSVVVTNAIGKIEGIFTTVDALEVLSDVLRRQSA
ncbi:MAG: CBS domain-containing protein [Kofleriaceae bacterium]|nr:CBS domain-containing protein [Kofleriaceae bacterium]